MVRVSKVNEGIPTFVKEYLDLKDRDELIWDENIQDGVKLFFELLRRFLIAQILSKLTFLIEDYSYCYADMAY